MPKGKSQSTFYDEQAFLNIDENEKLMQIMKYLLYLDSESKFFFLQYTFIF